MFPFSTCCVIFSILLIDAKTMGIAELDDEYYSDKGWNHYDRDDEFQLMSNYGVSAPSQPDTRPSQTVA